MISPDIITVSIMDDYQLLLTYENGERKQFDMKPYLDKKPFNQLLQNNLFYSAHVSYGTVEWTEDIDMSREYALLKIGSCLKF